MVRRPDPVASGLRVARRTPTDPPAERPPTTSLAELSQRHQLGVPTDAGLGAAIRQHVLDTPAPVVADALGYHHVTTTRLAAHAGLTWSHYAPAITDSRLHRELATVENASSPVGDS